MGLFKNITQKLGAVHDRSKPQNTDDNRHADSIAEDATPQNISPPPIPARDYLNVSNESRVKNIAGDDFMNKSEFPLVNHNFLEKPISTKPPISCITSSSIHPVPLPKLYTQQGPIQTNNFYGNMLVEDQNLPVWTHPYSVWKSCDDQFKGLGISHTEFSQKVYGDDPNSDPVKYFFNPVGICSLMLSADEFEKENLDFLVGDCQRFSIETKFKINTGEMHVNLVQGMGFVTGVYNGSITPRIASKVGIQSFECLKPLSNNLSKYVISLFDNTKWVLYTNTSFSYQSANSLLSNKSGTDQVIVQIAKLNDQSSIEFYDEVAGSYVIGCTLSADCNDTTCCYSFNYNIKGTSQSNRIIQWFFPHQLDSMDPSMHSSLVTRLQLDSTCKGVMSAFIIDNFKLIEELPPKELGFDPWSDKKGVVGYSEEAKSIIGKVAQEEISMFDVVNESNTDSMYTAGKILDKGAFMLYVTAYVLNNQNLTLIMLDKMKRSFERFIGNRQKAPLCYNNTWKGIVSTSGLEEGNFYCDFGNCFYNDHHFHYGYHIHAAAIIALVDKKFGDGSFVNQAKDWVETLIRDICNPSSKDPFFPVFRSFDFYNGHSFANGLFAHGDGKDEESSSEDYHAYYGIKLWGQVTNNAELTTLGSLILSIERRAMNLYMLYKNDNRVMPSKFIKNKVSGILFENKIDHATYFGMNKEYIHGIHMIPVTPVSNYIRSTDFVTEEWNEKELGQLASSIDGGWKGLLMLNSAIFDPQAAFRFFSQDNFQASWLDNGMSRTWSLAYCAGMGGC